VVRDVHLDFTNEEGMHDLMAGFPERYLHAHPNLHGLHSIVLAELYNESI
jgi:hypothetical protein